MCLPTGALVDNTANMSQLLNSYTGIILLLIARCVHSVGLLDVVVVVVVVLVLVLVLVVVVVVVLVVLVLVVLVVLVVVVLVLVVVVLVLVVLVVLVAAAAVMGRSDDSGVRWSITSPRRLPDGSWVSAPVWMMRFEISRPGWAASFCCRSFAQRDSPAATPAPARQLPAMSSDDVRAYQVRRRE